MVLSTFLLYPFVGFSAEDTESSMTALQNQIFKLQASQDNFDKQFSNAYQEIKKVEKQLPKLNDTIQAQLNTLQENNNKMMKEMQKANEVQLKELTAQLNTLKERLSKMPPKEG